MTATSPRRPAGLLARITAAGIERLPFADAVSDQLPLGRIMRLSLFQVSVGMVVALLGGTLNRVMIVELGVPTWMVAMFVGLPLALAPLRALIGFRSDHHRSAFGWRRVPYLWKGTLYQFGGLAIMPFALLLLSGNGQGPNALQAGYVGAAIAFMMMGFGAHMVQTAGLALATDLATDEQRPRLVALLYVALLVGVVASGLAFSALLYDFSNVRLIQVLQGAAVLTAVLNITALWKQERHDRERARRMKAEPEVRFRDAWRDFLAGGRAGRLLLATGLGAAAFGMQDILLEPYGAEILRLSVSATSLLTALMAFGSLLAFGLAARRLAGGSDPIRLGAVAALTGILGLAAVVFAGPLHQGGLFRGGTLLIGFGDGLWAVVTLVAAMTLRRDEANGLALGAWGAVEATANGLAVMAGGLIRDAVAHMAPRPGLADAVGTPMAGYTFVYHLEIGLLFLALIVAAPLARPIAGRARSRVPERIGLAELPG